MPATAATAAQHALGVYTGSKSTNAELQNITDLQRNHFLTVAWPYVIHFVVRPYGHIKTGLSELFSSTKRAAEAHGVRSHEGLQLVELTTFLTFTAVLRLVPLLMGALHSRATGKRSCLPSMASPQVR